MARLPVTGASSRREASVIVREPDYSLSYDASVLQQSRLARNVFRSTMISVFLMMAFLVSSVWISAGFGWAFDSASGLSPLLACPTLANYDALADADYCKVVIPWWDNDLYYSIQQNNRYATNEAEAKLDGLCVIPRHDAFARPYDEEQLPITCYSRSSCSATTNWTPLNPYSQKALNSYVLNPTCTMVVSGMQFSLSCYSILAAEPFCDANFTASPSVVVAIRGILLGIALLWILMLVYDLSVYIKVRNLNKAITEYRLTVLASRINAHRKELMNRCLLKWNSFISSSSLGGTSLRRASSVGSSSLPRTPTSESMQSPRAVLPFQPILTPRTSIAFDTMASPRGYSPRLDSPPVAVVSTINGCTARLNRFNGTVEVLFSTTWRKRVQKYFELRAKHVRLMKLKWTPTLVHLFVSFVVIVGFYILAFRLVLEITTGPFLTNLPGGLTLTQIAGLGSDRTPSSITGVVEADLAQSNRQNRRFLFLWTEFSAFVDLYIETGLLVVLALIAMLRPTKLVAGEQMQKLTTPLSGNMDDTRLPNSSSDFSSATQFKRPDDMSESDSPASILSSPISRHPAHAIPAPVPVARLRGPPFVVGSNRSMSSMESYAEPGIQIETGSESLTCILVSVMAPCSTSSGKHDFVKKMKAIRAMAESDSDIFVVDCGRSREPIDDTEFVLYSQLSDKIHYVYFPEPHRVLSLYWTSKYWIPFLFSSNMCGDYIYSLIVDDSVVFPSSFALPPAEFLLGNPKIKALYLPTAEGPSPAWTQRMQERIAIVAQVTLSGSAMHAGETGIAQIWERNTFEMTCFNVAAKPDTSGLNHILNLKINDRHLLRDRGCSQVAVWLPQGGAKPIRSLPSSAWRGVSAGVSISENLREFVDPSSYLHLASVLTKPVIITELANSLYDAIRLFLLTSMVLRDPVGLGLVAALSVLLTLAPLLLNLIVSARYEDKLLLKLGYLFTVYPFQIVLYTLPLRVVKLFKLKVIPMVFKEFDNAVTIGEREVEFRDLPIVPPHPVPHWATVWL